MLTLASIVQQNSGGFNGTTGNATLPTGTTSGNTLILCVSITDPVTQLTPAGFAAASDSPTLPTAIWYRGPTQGLAAGETSWTIVPNTTAQVAWVVLEVAGLDTVAPVDAKTSYSGAVAQSIATGNAIASGTAYDVLMVCAHGAYLATSATPPTWSGHTGGFAELVDQGAAGASTSVGLSVSTKFGSVPAKTADLACTATSNLVANGPIGAVAVAFASADAHRDLNVNVFAGFEQGTELGLNSGTTGKTYVETLAGTPTITASTPRSGSFCLELSSVAAAEWVRWGANLLTTTTTKVLRLPIHFPGSLPAADVDLASLTGTHAGVTIRYRTATQQIGVTFGAGSEQLSAATVAADTWYVLECLVDTRTTAHAATWSLDGIAQTPATVTGTAATTTSVVTLGWTGATTATVRYDDVVVMTLPANYGAGDFKVVLLKVDAAGTLVLTGVSTNWSTYTANGTLAAWDATVARDAVREGPPGTIGASSDGFCQIVNSTTTNIEIPMETYAVGDGAVKAIRMIVLGWAAGAGVAQFSTKGWEGANLTALTGTGAPFVNTSPPAWAVAMFKPADGWTQAKVDALAFRVGYSNDTVPNIGLGWIGAEALVQLATRSQSIVVDDGGFTVDTFTDPESGAALSYLVTCPADRGATMTATVSGTPTAVYVSPGTSYTHVVNAADLSSASDFVLEPDPTVN